MPTPQLRQASYRAVVFGVDAHDDESGRRLSIDSLPNRDLPLVADFGAEPRQISIEAFIVGADYQERADALQQACAARNTPGKLSLPNMASLVVRPLRCVRRERKDELRMARFLLTFVEVEILPAPSRKTGGVQSVDVAASLLSDAGVDTMAEDLAVRGVPSPAVVAAGDEVSKIGTALAALGTVRDATEQAVLLASEAAAFIRDAQSLVLEPVLLAARLSAAYELVIDTVGDAIASLYAYQTLASLLPDPYTSYLVSKNASLVSNAGRSCALGGWARAAARVEWTSYDEAVAARQALEAALDAHSLACGDAEYSALQSLRARVAAQVPAPGKNLPRLQRLVLPCTTSSLVLAYRLYDDVGREAEIVLRNKVSHPAFIPGGVTLQVLSRA